MRKIVGKWMEQIGVVGEKILSRKIGIFGRAYKPRFTLSTKTRGDTEKHLACYFASRG